MMGKEASRLGWLEMGGLLIVNVEARESFVECARLE
jgi:hypothetical protein